MKTRIRRHLCIGSAILLAHFGLAASVAVIQGNQAVPPGDRRFAQSLARHVERWYREEGVAFEASDDTNLHRALSNKRVAVLVYAAHPTPQQMQALTAFVGRGGKLIVCYSLSAELANLMGVQMTGYQKGSTEGRWSQMRFLEGAPKGTPPMLLQTSQNICVATPIPGRSQVLAWWHDRKGGQTAEAAWLSSSHGYWMTHVLLADGDAEGKGRLLLALTASLDPSLWLPAATHAWMQARTVCKTEGLDALMKRAETLADPNRRLRATAAVSGAQRMEKEGQAALAKGDGFQAWTASGDLRSRMYAIYGLLQSTRRGEIRAVWEHSGMGLYPGDWGRTCRLLKDAGFTDLYVNVAGAGFAHYASSILPRSRVFNEQGDQLAACLAAARPSGLRVHAWILCFSMTGATQERIDILHQRGWLLTKSDRSACPWVDPAVPAARAYIVDAVREMAMNYKVDGVHLDFVRYPDFPSSLGPGSQACFETSIRRRVARWPEDVKGDPFYGTFCRWRADQVTDFVQSARRAMRRDAPGKLLTAAVFGKYPSCVDSVGQEWESWLNIGLVDYVVPMNYTEDKVKFDEWITHQTRTRKQAPKIIAGLGVTASESRLDAVQVIDQINRARRAGASGFALFDLDTTLRQEILPVLRLGMTAPVRD